MVFADVIITNNNLKYFFFVFHTYIIKNKKKMQGKLNKGYRE